MLSVLAQELHSLGPEESARQFGVQIRWTPHPVIVTVRDNEDYIRVHL